MALTDNLVAYWKMDSGALTTDSHGSYTLTNKNTVGEGTAKLGTASGDFGSGANNKALHRDADVLSYTELGTAWTMNFWVYPTEVGTNTNRICRYILNNGSLERNCQLDIDTSGKFVFGTFDGTARSVTSSTTPSTNTWYMVTILYDGAMRLYVNGSSEGTPVSFTWSGFSRTTYSEMAIGAEMLNSGDTPTIGFDGYIDEVGFWNTNLSTDDITALYNSGDGFAYPFSVGPTYTLTCDSGSFTFSGQDITLQANRILSLDNGAFTLDGQDTGLYRGFTLSLGSGSFTVTGASSALDYSGFEPVNKPSTSWSNVSAAASTWTHVSASSTTWTDLSL